MEPLVLKISWYKYAVGQKCLIEEIYYVKEVFGDEKLIYSFKILKILLYLTN